MGINVSENTCRKYQVFGVKSLKYCLILKLVELKFFNFPQPSRERYNVVFNSNRRSGC